MNFPKSLHFVKSIQFVKNEKKSHPETNSFAYFEYLDFTK